MGKRRRYRKRVQSSSSSSTTSSSSSTSSPRPRKKSKVSRHHETKAVSTLNNIIPEFDPLNDDINAWLNIIQSYSATFGWSDETMRYQALNKLKGSGKVWYDSLLRTDSQWPTWKWSDWNRRLASSFQTRRNMFELLKEIINKKPIENQSLYEFYFDIKCKIDRLSLNFSEQDIISLIVGSIGDSNIGASIEASNFKSCHDLASYLHGRTYKGKLSKQTSSGSSRENQPKTVDQTNNNYSQLSTNVISSNNNANSRNANESIKTNSTQIRKPIKCYTCGGNHTRNQCDLIKCNFCNKKGHVEAVCRSKKSAGLMKPEIEETKLIQTPDPRNKFVKTISINHFAHEAFIDTGSSCSLVSESVVEKYSLQISILPSPVLLQGFSKHNSKPVTHKVTVNLKIDSVSLTSVDFYVIDDLVGCDILIGRNITERNDLIYSRVGNSFKFDYAQSLTEFCDAIHESKIDAETHLNELLYLIRQY
ncbi:uncharacterized protein LOC113497348 [Trichoplusia ni]|uniref:Uncharacterized protein LOC113497348 n=1 Tax=Trichoplusia ni TaxID=7111 RepID=A0A7E5VWG9_TRINI|nr:uncharacterized protein LOC113497348 [Trichoplusia ni]XP_026732675.1 uncharacterized protein LOC113497348 [Trichoplusia ni]XP_026732676.1 uncharacterized protein LOC113497348 [Trichoplusia ni]